MMNPSEHWNKFNIDALIFRQSLHLTMDAVLCAIFTIFHVSAITSGQTSCTRVTDPSVLEGNVNMILVDHVFYSEITSLRFCGIRYLHCFNIGFVLKSRHIYASCVVLSLRLGFVYSRNSFYLFLNI